MSDKVFYRQIKILALFSFLLVNFCCCSNEKLKKEESITGTVIKSVVANNAKKEDVSVSNAGEKHVNKIDEQLTGQQKLEEKYKSIIDTNFKSFDGAYSYGINIYGSGIRYTNGSKKMKSASVIKLFIMEYAYNFMEKEQINSETVISGRKLMNLIEKMITVSDNDATNLLIDYFTKEKLNEFFKECGYSDTILERRMLDKAAVERGEENYTSVNDVMNFLDKLYEGRNDKNFSEMLSIMKRQQISTKLRRDMPSGVEIASKSGELSDVQNDVGIVFSEKGDYAIVILSQGGDVQKAQNAMAKTCKVIYESL